MMDDDRCPRCLGGGRLLADPQIVRRYGFHSFGVPMPVARPDGLVVVPCPYCDGLGVVDVQPITPPAGTQGRG